MSAAASGEAGGKRRGGPQAQAGGKRSAAESKAAGAARVRKWHCVATTYLTVSTKRNLKRVAHKWRR